MTVRPDDAVTARECPACHATVPPQSFCGDCGARLDKPVTLWRVLMRQDVFAAAPRQPVMAPLVTSSLFARLSETSRRPFRLGLFLVLAALVVFSWRGFLGPLVVVTAFGIPLLFVLYMWQSDAFRDIPARALVTATVIGAATGSAWWLWAGLQVSHAYGIPLGIGSQMERALNFGFVLTLVGAVLMIVPAIVVRLSGWTTRESLDGFVIGALGALSHAAAGTITWFAPQFTAGLLNNYRPVRLLEESFLSGFVEPIAAAAAGGLIGLELWFRPNRGTLRHPGRLRAALIIFTLLVMSLYVAVYVVDASALSTAAELVINFALTAVVLLTLRAALQMALLHEEPDPATGEPVGCLHCDQTVPDAPFCPACGAATRASSRTWRRSRWSTSEAGRPAS